jgi:hypothetical protein
MKKLFLMLFLLFSAVRMVIAQEPVTAVGTVTDEHGKPIIYAFVVDSVYKYATYTDSTGRFTVKVVPNSNLQVIYNNYTCARFNVGAHVRFKIVLNSADNKAAFNVSNREASQKRTNPFKRAGESNEDKDFKYINHITYDDPTAEDTRGSMYLFDDWVHGFLVSAADSLIQSSDYLFNYDKITGTLLITQNYTSAVKASVDKVKSFTLFNDNGESYVFELIPAIDKKHYMQVLASGKKYNIYKNVKVHMVRNSYDSNGIASSGKNYDEYVDESAYYVLDKQTNTVQKFSPLEKDVKTVFTNKTAVNEFMRDHSSEKIDDNYLIQLGDDLNN